MAFMAFAPLAAQLGSSVIGGLMGQSSADAAAQAQKKAAKLQAQTAANQLNFAKNIYGTEQGIAASTLPQQTAAIKAGTTAEVNALRGGQTGALNALAANTAAQGGIYDPYRQAGQAGLDANAGFYGTDPASSDAMYNAFVNSPYYQATVAPAQAAAQQETERRFAGTGQAGAVGQALQDRLAEVGGRGFMDYVGFGERAANRGLEASGQYSGAIGRNAALGAGAYLDTAGRMGSAYGQGGQATSNALGDYLRTRAGLASGLSGAAASGFGNIINAQGARGAAQAAGQLGTGSAWGNAFNSASSAIGNYFAPQPAGYGPTNIVPRGY